MNLNHERITIEAADWNCRPEDVRAVCHDVLCHRIGLTYEAEAENITTEQIITDILNNVIVP